MQSHLYVALSAQKALQHRLDALAQNVANASTAGYRAEQLSFSTLISPMTSDPVSFANSGQDYLSTRGGALVKTDNPLDVAISGDAWFAVETPAGTAYTRDGRFRLSPEGELETLSGYKVLDAGGAPLQVDPAGEKIDVGIDGTVVQNGRTIGAIGIFEIPRDAKLVRVEGSSVVSDKPATPQLDFNRVRLAQGHYERSNVDPVQEMTRLVMIQRTFDAISNTITDLEGTFTEAIRSLGSS